MQDLAEYWAQDFDWRQTEARINAHPQFITDIEGHTIHFLHIRTRGQQAVPLLFVHGWPGSFLEMVDLIPLLTTTKGPCFDPVIPSLPGFGFSREVPQEEMNTGHIAHLAGITCSTGKICRWAGISPLWNSPGSLRRIYRHLRSW